MREALQHQRFPVQALERKAQRGQDQTAQRVILDFFPTAFSLDFGGVAASATMTNSGLVGGFGLVFSGAGDELFLSTLGAGHPLANLEVSDLADAASSAGRHDRPSGAVAVVDQCAGPRRVHPATG